MLIQTDLCGCFSIKFKVARSFRRRNFIPALNFLTVIGLLRYTARGERMMCFSVRNVAEQAENNHGGEAL